MTRFETEYQKLNAAQRQAVDTIDGPLLVIAGPGTGKTQLLSNRAANIVKHGQVGPSNILCLTYTEAGATEMRQRLTQIMGPTGGDVSVFTFHGFGSWLIKQYPEQFSQHRSPNSLDDLSTFSILEKLLSKLPLRHALAVRGENEMFIRQHAVNEAISAFKKAGMSPHDLRETIKTNREACDVLHPLIEDIYGSRLSVKRLEHIDATITQALASSTPHTLTAILLSSLHQAVNQSTEIGKTKPLGDWRNSHTINKNGSRILKSQDGSKLLIDTVEIYEQYQEYLTKHGKYDYQDMIMWAAEALETNQDIRLDIAERFQYIMVDEYQDTNGAQNRLLDAILSANPLDSPNVLVVGDDDQAIMRFQGAEVSGTLSFIERYNPVIIPLIVNYRSGQSILDASRQIIVQTDERLEVALSDLKFSKSLRAHKEAPGIVEHLVYSTKSTQFMSVANYIKSLLSDGVKPTEIAVIGRKHAELTEFVPFMHSQGIPIHYEGRQDILEDIHLQQLINLADYIYLLAKRPNRAETLLPSILAAPYWGLEPLATYKLAALSKVNKSSWLDAMLIDPDSLLAAIAEWLIACSQASLVTNFTQLFDILIGREPLKSTKIGMSPFEKYITIENPETSIKLLSHLIRLRRAVLEYRPQASGLADLLEVVKDYHRSQTRLTDSNPVLTGDRAGVQILSAHSTKGREFSHVIILSALDKVWGSKASGNSNRIRLPENLPLYPAGDAESDKLRLLYVAMTRAKTNLLITSYEQTDDGKKMAGLSYLGLGDSEDGWWQPKLQELDPTQRQSVLETSWNAKSVNSRNLKQMLDPLLTDYRLSPSAVRAFLDIIYSGPLKAIEQHVLKFPSAYSASSALGTAVHHTLHAAQKAQAAGKPLDIKAVLEVFDTKLDSSGLDSHEIESVKNHGHQFLPQTIEHLSSKVFGTITSSEEYLQATLPGTNMLISGSLDAISQTDGAIKIIDYKTGKPPLPDWKTTGMSDSKKASLHFYRQQLLCYKLLVDNSPKYQKSGGVTSAELIFVEPDPETGELVRLAITDFDQEELTRTARLINVIYNKIVNMELPDVTAYSKDLKGIMAFEADLIADN